MLNDRLAESLPPRRPKLDDRIKVAIDPVRKRRIAERAAAQNLTVAELVRDAVDKFVLGDEPAAVN